MCGIVGVAYKRDYGFAKKHVDIFTQLLRANELRGADSTGIIYVTKDKDFSILKEATPAARAHYNIMSHDLMKDILRQGKVLIGHNRAATVGKPTDENAHPFVVDNTFAMVHNGTLYGHKSLKDTDVDSEALAHHLQPFLEADEIAKEAFEGELGKVNGAYAIVSYSQKQNKVHLLRNAQRPLVLIETTDAFYWASEGLMLMWILSRNNEMSKDIKQTIHLKENVLYAINLNTMALTEEEYVPKKAIPARVTTAPTQNGTNKPVGKAVAPSEGKLSKQEVKRLRRRFLGTRHTFWPDDYIETHFPKTIADGETLLTLYGTLDGDAFPTGMDFCMADIDVEYFFGKSWTIAKALDGFYHGVIREIRYDRTDGKIQFILGDVKPLAKSTNITSAAAKLIEDTRSKWSASIPGSATPQQEKSNEVPPTVH